MKECLKEIQTTSRNGLLRSSSLTKQTAKSRGLHCEVTSQWTYLLEVVPRLWLTRTINSREREKEATWRPQNSGVKWNWQSDSDAEFGLSSLQLGPVSRFSSSKLKVEGFSFHSLLLAFVSISPIHTPVVLGFPPIKHTFL